MYRSKNSEKLNLHVAYLFVSSKFWLANIIKGENTITFAFSRIG